MLISEILSLYEGTLDFKALEKRKVPLTDEEREEVMKKKAVWHHGPHGEATPAVWKSKDSKGKTVYVTNTHRVWQHSPSLKGAIGKYHSVVKQTA